MTYVLGVMLGDAKQLVIGNLQYLCTDVKKHWELIRYKGTAQGTDTEEDIRFTTLD